MGLEATMIILDSSEYMRNGDYFPTRLSAEQEAAFSVFSAKMRAHPQSSVGLMTLNGKVLVSFVSNSGKFQAELREIKTEREDPSLNKSLQVAQLALRHRQPSQHQRIIVFVGSPIKESSDELSRLASRLKKNGVAVDVVNFGQEAENSAKLHEFVAMVNANDNSHFLDVPPGVDELVEQVSRSAILTGGRDQGDGGLGNDMDFEDDPELAMALRMSLEEMQRQERPAQA